MQRRKRLLRWTFTVTADNQCLAMTLNHKKENKMKKNVLLSTFLIMTVVALSSMQVALAATFASQTVTGTLGLAKDVVTNGGNINATIDENTGLLSAALVPGFTLKTNTGGSFPVALKAEANTTGGLVNAFDATGGFIALANNTVLPAAGEVGNAISLAPSTSANVNVIAYPIKPPIATAGELTYIWNAGLTRWDGTLTHHGNTNTSITIPATTPRVGTWSLDDASGAYQAIITLSFV